jgi:cob(I)alamin adenosyltransferase
VGDAAQALLLEVQRELMNYSAQLACCKGVEANALPLVGKMEREIDALQATLPPLRGFVVPGDSVASSQAHIVRCVCRRAERSVVALLDGGEEISPYLLQLLNRLSDYLFTLARTL